MLTIVGIVSLDKTPAIDVDDLTSAPSVAAKHVKAADHLPEPVTNATRPGFLFLTQVSDKPAALVRKRPDKHAYRQYTHRISLPSVLRLTTPSTTGDLRVSACV